MRCLDCGTVFTEKMGSLRLDNDIVGAVTVEDVSYFKCGHCGEFLFSSATLKAIEKEEKRLRDKLINSLPISEFIGATKVADMLGMSRQAIHKHRRIRRGFIYTTNHEGRILYHKRSVELYRDTGDGRFTLLSQPELPEVKYIVCGVSSTSGKQFSEMIVGEKNLHNWYSQNHEMIGQNYAD